MGGERARHKRFISPFDSAASIQTLVDVCLSFSEAPDAIIVRTGFMKRMKLLVLMRSYETVLYQTLFDFITVV